MEQTTKNKSFTQIACVLCLFAIGICICPGFRIGRRRTYPSPECSHSRISPKQTMLFGCALMQISHYTRAFCFVLCRWCWLMLADAMARQKRIWFFSSYQFGFCFSSARPNQKVFETMDRDGKKSNKTNAQRSESQ